MLRTVCIKFPSRAKGGRDEMQGKAGTWLTSFWSPEHPTLESQKKESPSYHYNHGKLRRDLYLMNRDKEGRIRFEAPKMARGNNVNILFW